MTATTGNKNNYAYEIRFVDDDIVQVFDIAAKRQQQEGNNNLLPHEYKQEEVLKGQLRYSKLVGAPGSTTTTAGGIFDDNNGEEPYEHQVSTKKSKNRRSIQRHTFFGMGGGGEGGGGGPSSYYDFSYSDDEKENDKHKPSDLKNQNIDCSNHQDENSMRVVQEQATAPPSPTPSTVRYPSVIVTLAAMENIPLQSVAIKEQQPVQAPLPAVTHGKHVIDSNNGNNNMYNNNISLNQISPIPQKHQKPYTIPHPHTQQTQPQPQQQYYTEDYTSMTMIDSNDYDSKRNMHQQQESSSKEKSKAKREGGCCCIIS